jgi:hypothetical protein
MQANNELREEDIIPQEILKEFLFEFLSFDFEPFRSFVQIVNQGDYY